MRTRRLVAALSVGSFLFLAVGAAATSVSSVGVARVSFQRFEGGFSGFGHSKAQVRRGSVGLSVDFSLVSDFANRRGALFQRFPFATLFADLYIDRRVHVRPFVAAECPPERIKALDPTLNIVSTCEAVTQLGRGLASGYARAVSSPPGQSLRRVELQSRLFRGPSRSSFILYVYSEFSKENLIFATVSRIRRAGPYGTRVRFVIPRGLIAPAPSIISQLSGFQIRVPATAAGGQGVFRLSRCPTNRKVRLGFRADYNENLFTNGPVKNADGYAVTSSSPLLGVSSPCR